MNYLYKLWNVPLVNRAVHTFYQAVVAYLLVAVQVQHQPLHNIGDVHILLVGAFGAGVSALRTLVPALIQAYRG